MYTCRTFDYIVAYGTKDKALAAGARNASSAWSQIVSGQVIIRSVAGLEHLSHPSSLEKRFEIADMVQAY